MNKVYFQSPKVNQTNTFYLFDKFSGETLDNYYYSLCAISTDIKGDLNADGSYLLTTIDDVTYQIYLPYVDDNMRSAMKANPSKQYTFCIKAKKI